MADVRPFRGFRYHSDTVKDLSAVITPPYDVIGPAEQARYYERHPLNVIRLELGRDEPGDDTLANRYTRAAADFARWRLDGALRLDTTPAFYIYQQQFAINGQSHTRTSVVTRVRLEPWEAGVILPHERTLAKAKDDRLRLLRACVANLSPILSLYDDAGGVIAWHLTAATATTPAIDVADDTGERHRLWLMTDRAAQEAIGTALAGRQLFIADGHHRYETALAYRDEVRKAQHAISPDDAANFVMMALAATDDPGLVVLPTHRLVRGLDDATIIELPDTLGKLWSVTALDLTDDADALTARLAESGATAQAAIVATRDRRWLVTLKAAGKKRLAATGEPESWRQLDVAAVHEAIIDSALGIPRDAITTSDQISFSRDARAALDAVAGGEAQVAILLNPTRPRQVRDVAIASGRMPQKSTYFYPKLVTGLVINPLW